MAPAEPKPSNNTSSPDTNGEKKIPEVKGEAHTKNEPARPLAPPPKPGEGGDYFGTSQLSLEPNPFEQSFGTGGTVETPGGTKLPSLAALTSPSSLLPGGNGGTPFNWGGGSLRTGPLSPAMLSGPATDYFGDTSHTLRSGFTPNESSLRTGLTPGGSGSMFPVSSPNSQVLFAQLANGGGATPGTIDFHRTALTAAAKARDKPLNPPSVTSQPQEPNIATIKAETKPVPGAVDSHDNDAANGLFMLAQGAQARNTHPQTHYPVGGNQPVHAHPPPVPTNQTQTMNTSPQTNGNGVHSQLHVRGGSEARSNMSEGSEQAKPNRGRRRGTSTTSVRRKAEEAPARAPPAKKTKSAPAAPPAPSAHSQDDMTSDEDDDDDSKHGGDGQNKTKMTDEEKRKNFLERNRVAALKCRQRKKQWLANLQSKVEMYSTENDHLTNQVAQLREEVVNLKTLLLAHKDCPVTQQQGLHGYIPQPMESYNPQMNPYGMAAPLPSQATVMAGQGGPRRYS